MDSDFLKSRILHVNLNEKWKVMGAWRRRGRRGSELRRVSGGKYCLFNQLSLGNILV
jgi:hypothetical protein